MNNLKLIALYLILSGTFVVECSDDPRPTKRRKTNSQELLFNGVRVSNFDAIRSALNDKSVDINAFDKDGETVLTLLVKRSSMYEPQVTKAILIYLLKNGARLDLPNKEGRSPIQVAKDDKNMDFIYAVDQWKHHNTYMNTRMEQLRNFTPLDPNSMGIVADYAYEIQDPEIKDILEGNAKVATEGSR